MGDEELQESELGGYRTSSVISGRKAMRDLVWYFGGPDTAPYTCYSPNSVSFGPSLQGIDSIFQVGKVEVWRKCPTLLDHHGRTFEAVG